MSDIPPLYPTAFHTGKAVRARHGYTSTLLVEQQAELG
jgi:hypothetical protein